MADCGTKLNVGTSESNSSHIWEMTLRKGDSFTEKWDKKSSLSHFHHCIFFPSPPLFAMLTSFQFTQSVLPTPLAAPLPCDSCWPIAAEAHLVPCEAGASPLHHCSNRLPWQRTRALPHCFSICAASLCVYLSVC